MVYMVPKRNSVLAPYSAKTELTLAPYGAKNGITFWHHMVPHGASWCQKVPKRGTQIVSVLNQVQHGENGDLKLNKAFHGFYSGLSKKSDFV